MADSQKITIGPLKDTPGVRRELARVYRAARHGVISTEHARALAALLGDIRRCFVDDDSTASTTPRRAGKPRRLKSVAIDETFPT